METERERDRQADRQTDDIEGVCVCERVRDRQRESNRQRIV